MKVLKQFLEIFLSFWLFVFLIPIFVIIAFIIKLTSKGPIIHWSKRLGKDNTYFLMPKFRTMKMNTPDLATHLLDSPKNYITPFGEFLRKTSLDELPQLWSILKSDMSFVGPRPALHNQVDLRELRTQNGIHRLRPGITGLAQISGRDEISIAEKVKFEKIYLQKQSFFFDCKIIFLTFIRVFLQQDISH